MERVNWFVFWVGKHRQRMDKRPVGRPTRSSAGNGTFLTFPPRQRQGCSNGSMPRVNGTGPIAVLFVHLSATTNQRGKTQLCSHHCNDSCSTVVVRHSLNFPVLRGHPRDVVDLDGSKCLLIAERSCSEAFKHRNENSNMTSSHIEIVRTTQKQTPWTR